MQLNLIEHLCLKTKQNTIEKQLKKMKTNFNNLLEMVGNTPVVKINNIDTGPVSYTHLTLPTTPYV